MAVVSAKDMFLRDFIPQDEYDVIALIRCDLGDYGVSWAKAQLMLWGDES